MLLLTSGSQSMLPTNTVLPNAAIARTSLEDLGLQLKQSGISAKIAKITMMKK